MGVSEATTSAHLALALYRDQKSQIRALDRTQPGRPETVTLDFKRNGRAPLIEVLTALDGKVFLSGDVVTSLSGPEPF